ncbi:MAG: hypothetical protein V1644_03020 [Candidatus Micrarchaeota archaeon]
MNKITTIIFDWGGVLTVEKHSFSIKKMLKVRYEINISNATLCKLLDKMDCNKLTIEKFTQIINEKFNYNISTKEMAAVFDDAIKPNV